MSAAPDPLLARADVWRGQRIRAPQPTLASGHAALDAALPGGGWPLGVLVEVCSAYVGLGETSLLLPALASLTRARRWVAWVDPPGLLDAPALVEAGVDPGCCVVVEPGHVADPRPVSIRGPGSTPAHRRTAPRAADGARRDASPLRQTRTQPALWAAEQLLRGGACAAVLVWWADDDGHALRRLQLAAETGGALCVLFRPLARAARISPAALRLRVDAGGVLEIFKCRGTAWHAGRGATLRWRLATPRWRPPGPG